MFSLPKIANIFFYLVISELIKKRRKAIEELEEEYIKSYNAPSTRHNKETHLNRYLDFCALIKMKPFPISKFKICKYAMHLANTVKTIQAIKAYCSTVCDENEIRGFRPVHRGLKYYRMLAGIRRNKHHQVKRAQPMTPQLLERILQVVNLKNQKEFVIWSSMLTGYFVVLRKSNFVPMKRFHDTVHNICRRDVKYTSGVMVIFVRWSKMNQYGEKTRMVPIVGDNHKKICPVRWLLWMMDVIPAGPCHNLFSYRNVNNEIVPITYRDLMVHMRKWLNLIGENAKDFSSHSLRRGATTQAYKANLDETAIQRLGDWSSTCFRSYIEEDMQTKVKTWYKFNNK